MKTVKCTECNALKLADMLYCERHLKAEKIVRAVNSHETMLHLLKQLQEEFEAGRTLGIRPGTTFALNVRDAIALAEGKE